MKLTRSLLLACGLAVAVAAPAQAAEYTVTGQASLSWDPPDLPIVIGDTVTWQFADTTQNHNVQSDARDTADAEWNRFESPIGMPAQPKSFTFTAEGTYTYVCIVHPSTMRGTVRVGATPPPPPPPLPLSAQKFANDDATVLPAETIVLDKAKPSLSSVSARRSARGAARVRFRVSEESVVAVRLRRAGRTVKLLSRAGSGVLGVTATKLKAGRYSIEVQATDIAGNRSTMRKVSLTVR